jgi:hypothetical protein
VVVENLDVAADQDSSKEGLPAPASPRLSDDRSGHGRNFPGGEQGSVPSPHPPLPTISRDERSGVVGDAH